MAFTTHRQFFSLGGTWKDYYTGDVVAAPTWGPLAFYVLEDTVVTGTIQMIPTPGISEETILFEAATSYDPVALGDDILFQRQVTECGGA